MDYVLDAVCPLCSQICTKEHLHSHIHSEQPRVRQRTIAVIRGHHAWWSIEHGACEPCWKSFREAGRALTLLRQMKPQRPGHVSGETELAGRMPNAKAA